MSRAPAAGRRSQVLLPPGGSGRLAVEVVQKATNFQYISWESRGTTPMPPPGNKAVLRPYWGIMVANSPLTRPYFVAGWHRRGILRSP